MTRLRQRCSMSNARDLGLRHTIHPGKPRVVFHLVAVLSPRATSERPVPPGAFATPCGNAREAKQWMRPPWQLRGRA